MTMQARLAELAERRANLVAQAAAQRSELAHAAEPWRMPAAIADKGVAAARYLRHRPLLLAGGALVLAVLRPRTLIKWMPRALMAWRILHHLKRRLHSPSDSIP